MLCPATFYLCTEGESVIPLKVRALRMGYSVSATFKLQATFQCVCVQSLSHVRPFATLWTVHSLLKAKSIEYKGYSKRNRYYTDVIWSQICSSVLQSASVFLNTQIQSAFVSHQCFYKLLLLYTLFFGNIGKMYLYVNIYCVCIARKIKD